MVSKRVLGCLIGICLVMSGCIQLAGDVDEETGEYWFFSISDPYNNATTNGTDDYLIRMVIAENQTDDFELANIGITLTVDSTTYVCSSDTSGDCTFTLSGSDSTWSNEEYLNVSESGANICGSEGCGIIVTVTYDGDEIFKSTEALEVD